MTEREHAIALANHILDRVSADPDDDLAVLSRQLLRSLDLDGADKISGNAARDKALSRIREHAVTALECTKSARSFSDVRRYIQRVIDGVDVEMALNPSAATRSDAEMRELLAHECDVQGAHGIASCLRKDEITGGWPIIALAAMKRVQESR